MKGMLICGTWNKEKLKGIKWDVRLLLVFWLFRTTSSKLLQNRISESKENVMRDQQENILHKCDIVFFYKLHDFVKTLNLFSYLSKASITKQAASMILSSLPSKPLKRYILPLTSTTKRSCLGSCCTDPGCRNQIKKEILTIWRRKAN